MTNRGTAYIIYTDEADAEAAIAHMHEAQLDGAVINVSVVLPRRKFSRSPPPSQRLSSYHDRMDARGPPPGAYRGPPPRGPPRYPSPPPRCDSPPRRYRGPYRDRDNVDTWRPRSYSRSRSPRRRSVSRSYTRSISRSPPPRRQEYRRRDTPPRRGGGGGGGGRRRRSPSYSSYGSYSDRSRSFSRDRGRGRR